MVVVLVFAAMETCLDDTATSLGMDCLLFYLLES